MGTNESDSLKKLENHLKLLKEEYRKLQQSYTDLEHKHCKNATTEFNSFVSQLSIKVASLFGRSVYSDIKITLGATKMPSHKFVLSARSEEWCEEVLIDTNELDWSFLEEDVGIALLRWLYTDIVDLQNDRLALGLLQAAHRFKLPALLGLCERALITSVDVHSCVRFYCVAEEVCAASLLNYCSNLISTHWDDLSSQDFEHMSGPLLFKMLKSKTKYPLHSAIRLLREDVVFLCLVENDGKFPDLVNSLSEQGHLPLQMALMAKNSPIAETLIKIGCADINAYNNEGSTILIDAIKRGDDFAANFLLDHDCGVDFSCRQSKNTALHYVCTYDPSKSDPEIFSKMVDLGKKLIDHKPNVNLQNGQGETPLHMAILSKNNIMCDLLLSMPDIDINIQTMDNKSALELTLLQQTDDSLNLATKLLQLKAQVNMLKPVTQNNLLQELASNQLEEAAMFIVENSNIDHINSFGFTALHIAAKQNLPNLVQKLLCAGASPNVQSSLSDLKSPIHLAVETNAPKVLEEFANFFLKADNNNDYQKYEKPDFNCKDAKGDSPLSLSLSLKQKNLVPILIRGGADVNARNGQDLTLLHQAILNFDTATATFLLEKGADMNALTSDQDSPLQLAIRQRMPDVVDKLCTLGVTLGAPSNKGDPPLWTALLLEFEDVVKVLVQHGVDTDCWGPGPDGCQQTLLHRAIDENKETAAIFLIRSGCDLDSPRQPGPNSECGDEANDKASPLHLCAQWGLTNVIQALIDHGANVNTLDKENKSPIHIAIENQNEEIISILLCHPNIDLKMRDKNGRTPFAVALAIRNHKAAQRILDRLPNAAEQMDKRGRNFLHLAIMENDLESVLFLLAIQVDVNSRVHNAIQSTPLHLAASSSNEMITRNLILAGARINERDANQKTPLQIAAEHGNLTTISALIQNSADYDATDGDGNNALHIAVRTGNLANVRELLIESNINAEAVNFKGRNPLHELCRTGEDNTAASICELFFECMPEFPLNATDMDGNTPLLLAFMRGQAPLCKVLVKNGACLGTENQDGISIFTFKLATDQLLRKLLNQLPQESPWSESDLCQECGTKFTLTMRKHHCRHCGRVLCSKCSNNDIPILKFGINKPVRVCGVCFSVLQGGNDMQ